METSSAISVLEQVCERLGTELGIDPAMLNRSSEFEKLGMDSLDFINFILELRDITGEIENRKLIGVSTVGDLVDLIESR